MSARPGPEDPMARELDRAIAINAILRSGLQQIASNESGVWGTIAHRALRAALELERGEHP